MTAATSGTGAAARPLPVSDARSAPYWEAAARHELALARCSQCLSFALPAADTCPRCLSTHPGFVYEPVSGAGAIRSWTVVRQSFLPGFAGDVPFTLVDVELDVQQDLRMIGRLLDQSGAGSEPALGHRVRLVFEDLARGVAVPAFALVEDHS